MPTHYLQKQVDITTHPLSQLNKGNAPSIKAKWKMRYISYWNVSINWGYLASVPQLSQPELSANFSESCSAYLVFQSNIVTQPTCNIDFSTHGKINYYIPPLRSSHTYIVLWLQWLRTAWRVSSGKRQDLISDLWHTVCKLYTVNNIWLSQTQFSCEQKAITIDSRC